MNDCRIVDPICIMQAFPFLQPRILSAHDGHCPRPIQSCVLAPAFVSQRAHLWPAQANRSARVVVFCEPELADHSSQGFFITLCLGAGKDEWFRLVGPPLGCVVSVIFRFPPPTLRAVLTPRLTPKGLSRIPVRQLLKHCPTPPPVGG